MIHLRVVSPPDITDGLVPVLRRKPAVMNLTVLRSTVSNPDEDAVQSDVPQGVADEVVARLRHLGVEQRGSIVLQNIAASVSGLRDAATADPSLRTIVAAGPPITTPGGHCHYLGGEGNQQVRATSARGGPRES